MVTSAGILLYRLAEPASPELLIAHMGGPFWARKDERAWSIPKGEHAEDETPEDAARREFTEELGCPPPTGDLVPLGVLKQPGKRITVFALEGDFDVNGAIFGEFEMEWPPRSGQVRSFPEVDRLSWVDCATARVKLTAAQAVLPDRLLAFLGLTDG
ncbi:NUDIX domain-containing protein [Longispora albida]|uniref:NUDIX domain-containing protein n=1 Tax=Longispora albida TaxID=203523 RepID=UPI00036F30B4|nr:NUDIX domain-containing protein [Longispora albida]